MTPRPRRPRVSPAVRGASVPRSGRTPPLLQLGHQERPAKGTVVSGPPTCLSVLPAPWQTDRPYLPLRGPHDASLPPTAMGLPPRPGCFTPLLGEARMGALLPRNLWIPSAPQRPVRWAPAAPPGKASPFPLFPRSGLLSPDRLPRAPLLPADTRLSLLPVSSSCPPLTLDLKDTSTPGLKVGKTSRLSD